MRNITTLLLAMLFCTAAFAQDRVVPTDKLTHKVTYKDVKEQILLSHSEENMLRAQQYFPKPVTDSRPSAAHKVSTVAPIEIGRASNAYSILRGEQNQVAVIDSLGVIAFIHRQDVTIWGGGGTENGKLRYDLSVDGGSSFTSDIGVLNDAYTRPARYPNIIGFNNSGESNPFSANLVWVAPSLDPQPDWDGHVSGISDITTGTPTTTENYDFLAQRTLLPGGLSQGLPGEFWSVDIAYSGGTALDSVYTYKGTYNATSQDVDWARVDASYPPYATSFDGSPTLIGPNIAFSPDGMNGWTVLLSDLAGVAGDSTVQPVLRNSTDGGATWGNWMEVDLNSVAWVADTLKSLWTDSVGNPASSGRATCSFDYDITVDADGNPHVITIIGSGSSAADPNPGYSIFPSLAMFAADIFSTDGGTTWDIAYLGPVLSFRGEFGVPDNNGNLLTMDNQPQASRSEDGTVIFGSWVDSDTLVTGFGESANLAPNLRIVGRRISDNFRTCWKQITDGDLIWDGRALYPTLAPVVITKSNGATDCYNLPIVVLDMITNDQLQPCRFFSFTQDANFEESEFVDPSTLDLSWTGGCYGVSSTNNCAFVGIQPNVNIGEVMLFQSYPNPTNGTAVIEFEISKPGQLELDMVNMYGQQVAVLTQGEFEAGQHEVNVNTDNLAPGVYFYNLHVGEKVFTRKMVVTK